MLPTIVKSCLIKIFDNSIMPKRSGRKLKGGALADSLPNVSNSPKQPNVSQQMKPPAMTPKSLANSPQMNIPSPPKPASPDNLSNTTSIPGAGLAEKSLQTAEEGISFFEEYGYQIAIGGIVLLIVGILAYYFVFRDNPKKDSSTTGAADSTNGSTSSTTAGTASSTTGTAGSSGSTTAGSSGSTTSGSTAGTAGSTSGTAGSTTAGSSGSTAGTAGSSGTTSSTTNTNSNTEGFTTEILDTIVNGDTVNKEEDKEFPAGRPDMWIPEKNPLLPGRNI